MAEGRFEKYVRETLADGTKARRDELAAAIERAEADLDAKEKALQEIAGEACAEADRKIRALVRRWGWTAAPGSEKTRIVEPFSLRSNLSSAFVEFKTTYERRGDVYADWHVGGPVAVAQRKLAEFDDAVEKAARRLVVVKKDLGMKAEAFDKAMAEAVAKLMK